MLARVLALHPNILSLHEPQPYLRPENYLAWENKTDPTKLVKWVGEKRNWLLEEAEHNNLMYVESSHFCSFLVPYLDVLYKPRYIHLIRDGRDFVRSGMSRKWYTEYDEVSSIPNTLVKRHRLDPPVEANDRFKKIAWLWAETNKSIRQQLENHPNHLAVKLEEFSYEKYCDMCDFLEADWVKIAYSTFKKILESKPNKNEREFLIPPKEEWDAEMNLQFMKFAGDEMRHWGYV